MHKYFSLSGNALRRKLFCSFSFPAQPLFPVACQGRGVFHLRMDISSDRHHNSVPEGDKEMGVFWVWRIQKHPLDVLFKKGTRVRLTNQFVSVTHYTFLKSAAALFCLLQIRYISTHLSPALQTMAARPGTSISKRIPCLGACRKSAECRIQKKEQKNTPSAGVFLQRA